MAENESAVTLVPGDSVMYRTSDQSYGATIIRIIPGGQADLSVRIDHQEVPLTVRDVKPDPEGRTPGTWHRPAEWNRSAWKQQVTAADVLLGHGMELQQQLDLMHAVAAALKPLDERYPHLRRPLYELIAWGLAGRDGR